MRKRIECVVTGRVQFVTYRYFTLRKAHKLGIVGTAENLNDGTVRVIGEGEEKALDAFLMFLRRGPILANVENVDVQFKDPKNEFSEFRIIY